MDKSEAEQSQRWFKEEFMTPENWSESYFGYPEPVVGEEWRTCELPYATVEHGFSQYGKPKTLVVGAVTGFI